MKIFLGTMVAIALGLTVSPSAAQISHTNGLVSYYPLNGNAADLSGKGNNGQVFNTSGVADRFGTSNSALEFNGQNAQVIVPDNLALQSLTSNYTFNIWARFSSFPSRDMCFLMKSFGPGSHQNKWTFWHHANPPNGVGILVNRDAQDLQSAADFPFATNQWHMLTFISTGTNAVIAVDGVVVSTQAGDFTLPDTSGIALSIGGPEPGDIQWFHGALDDLRIYNRSLSTNEVAEIFETEGRGLVAFYPLDGNAEDASGYANHGAVSNAVTTINRFGMTNSAFSFNGQNAQVLVNDNPALQTLNSAYTFNVWAKFGAFPNYDMCLLMKSFGPGSGVNKWTLWRHVNSPLGIGALIGRAGGVTSQFAYNHPLSLNRWYMITFSSTGTNAFIAVNGIVVATQSGNLALPNTTGASLSIGGPEPTGYQWFNGAIDDVRIYNRALSPAQVEKIYAKESGQILNLRKAVYVDSSTLILNETYQLQYSTNLIDWVDLEAPFVATNSNWRSTQYVDVESWNNILFRLQPVP